MGKDIRMKWLSKVFDVVSGDKYRNLLGCYSNTRLREGFEHDRAEAWKRAALELNNECKERYHDSAYEADCIKIARHYG